MKGSADVDDLLDAHRAQYFVLCVALMTAVLAADSVAPLGGGSAGERTGYWVNKKRKTSPLGMAVKRKK
jgi:hypothetical protein